MTDTFTAQQCTACDELHTDDDLVRVYTCPECEENTEERRCDQCNKFTRRSDHGDGCPTCYAECEPVEAVYDHDGALIPADEYDPDGASLAARSAEASARAAAERAARDKATHAKRVAAGTQRTWATLQPGDVVVPDEPDAFELPRPVVYVSAPTADGMVGVYVSRGSDQGTAPIVGSLHPADEPVTVEGTPRPVPDLSDLYPVAASERTIMSSSQCDVSVETAPCTSKWEATTAPGLNIVVGRRMVTAIGAWDCRALAQRGLDQLERVAYAFADAQGITLDAAAAAQGHPKVTHNARSMLSFQLTGVVPVTIGEDAWADEDDNASPVRAVFNTAATMVVLDDPAPLLAAVHLARGLLDTLTH